MKIIIGVLIVTICYLFLMTKLEYYRESNLITLTSQQDSSKASSSSSSSSIVIEEFSIEITGYVKNPGKYDALEGDSLYSILEKAGGVLDEADLDCFDMYYSLTNEDTSIYIGKDNGGNKISINTADLETLQILPGIGETIAQNIINYRDEYGSFRLLDHIKRVNGIKDATFNKIKDFIKL